MSHRAAPACLVILTALLLLAACGGSGASGSTAESASLPAEPSTESTEPSTAEPSESAGVDLGTAAGDVSNLDSYRLDITFDTDAGPQTMSVIATHTPTKATHYIVAGQEIIVIEGVGAWTKTGDTWTETPDASMYTQMFDAMAPDTFLNSFALDAYGQYFQDTGTEQKNGVSARHYHVDASALAGLPDAADFPEDGTFDVWVSEDGDYLVGMAFSGTVKGQGQVSYAMDVSQVNDPSIVIEPPI